MVYYPSVRSPEAAARAARAGKSGKEPPGIRQPPTPGLLASAARTMTEHGAAQGAQRGYYLIITHYLDIALRIFIPRDERMAYLSEIKKMEVLSSDGTVVGTVEDVTIDDQWNIKGLTLRLDKNVARSMGKPVPAFSALKLDVGLDIIKSIGEKVVLNQPLAELGAHVKAQEGVRRASSFMGMKVISTEGKILGKINDISMEMQSWKMPSLAITVPRDVLDELKTKKPVLGKGKILLSMVHIKSIKDYVMLDTDYQGLSRILETATVKAQ